MPRQAGPYNSCQTSGLRSPYRFASAVMSILFKLLLAVAPFLLTALFGWLVMDGHLNFGGGEKDVFLLVPLLLWSLAYLCSFLALWWRRSALGRSIVWSAGLATGFVVVAFFILFGATSIWSR